ncbi:FAD-dependent monooxygenase [Streptomyces tubercidicus]|uniref:FAD-dependent monooxygenase n=1 Tax=Streptomyces tubercidicus TaxID=47759 RepID=UPI003465381F
MDTDVDVLIADAGPTGLLLANELGLAEVRTAVAERLPRRTGQSKALNLQPRTAEVLDCRGWLEPLLDRSLALLPSGHFAGLPLNYGALDTAFPHQVGIPQARVEEFLEDHLAEYGVPVLRDRELTSFQKDTDGVTATLPRPGGAHAPRPGRHGRTRPARRPTHHPGGQPPHRRHDRRHRHPLPNARRTGPPIARRTCTWRPAPIRPCSPADRPHVSGRRGGGEGVGRPGRLSRRRRERPHVWTTRRHLQ